MGLKQRSSGIFYNLKIEKQAFPTFQKVGKENGEWVTIEEAGTYEGFFVNAKIEEYEYDKKPMQKLVMEFHDEEGNKETVSCNFNSLALNIINTLAAQDSLAGRKITFTVYSKKDKEGKDRARIFTEIDGQKTEWKFGPEVVAKIYEHHQKWVDMFDKYVQPMIDSPAPKEEEDDDVFEAHNKATEEKKAEKKTEKAPVKGGKKETVKASDKKSTKKEPEPEPEEEEEEDFDDDLPF